MDDDRIERRKFIGGLAALSAVATLLQFHENIRLEDPDRFFATGGAVEAVARRGKEE
jgi:hypothetical protein